MTNVIFAGVGGQGVILSTKVLMHVALSQGYDVKESEIHGMAQRGGSVDCHVRFGEQVHSPLIAPGTADFIVALELLEAARRLDFLAPQGRIITDTRQIDPMPVLTGQMTYPDDLADWLDHHSNACCLVETGPALKILGSSRVLNVVMLGVLSQYLTFDAETWQNSLKATVKPQHVDLNLHAFELGRTLLGSS